MPTPNKIRESILASKGLRINIVEGRKVITDQALLPIDASSCKTRFMLYVESHFKKSIEELIWSDSKEKVAKKLEIAERTVSNWRVKFPRNCNSDV